MSTAKTSQETPSGTQAEPESQPIAKSHPELRYAPSGCQNCIEPVNAPNYTPFIAGGVHPELTAFIRQVPWHQLLGVQVLELRPGYAKLLLPLSPYIKGNASRGVLHGGMMAALADSCAVAALWTHFGPDDRVATVDLRVDYLRPAPDTAGIIAEGEVRLLGGSIGNIHVRMFSEADPSLVVAEGRTVCYMRRAK